MTVGILCVTSCSLFEEEAEKEKDISINSTFDDTAFSGYFTLDGETIPLDGAYVQITHNSVFKDIIINLAPAGSEGSVAFPGLGWVQFRFHTDVKTGNVIPTAMQNDFTVSSNETLDPLLFNGLYISPENESWKLKVYGEVLDNSIVYNASDDYSFDFSFQSDASWEREYGDNSVETKNGEINFAVSVSSSGSQGGSGENDAGGVDCSGGYNGPEFDIQIDSQCQAAYAYACSGAQEGVDAACSLYKGFQSQDSSIPDCPYCN